MKHRIYCSLIILIWHPSNIQGAWKLQDAAIFASVDNLFECVCVCVCVVLKFSVFIEIECIGSMFPEKNISLNFYQPKKPYAGL